MFEEQKSILKKAKKNSHMNTDDMYLVEITEDIVLRNGNVILLKQTGEIGDMKTFFILGKFTNEIKKDIKDVVSTKK